MGLPCSTSTQPNELEHRLLSTFIQYGTAAAHAAAVPALAHELMFLYQHTRWRGSTPLGPRHAAAGTVAPCLRVTTLIDSHSACCATAPRYHNTIKTLQEYLHNKRCIGRCRQTSLQQSTAPYSCIRNVCRHPWHIGNNLRGRRLHLATMRLIWCGGHRSPVTASTCNTPPHPPACQQQNPQSCSMARAPQQQAQ
jgi:hypothetical protein